MNGDSSNANLFIIHVSAVRNIQVKIEVASHNDRTTVGGELLKDSRELIKELAVDGVTTRTIDSNDDEC